MTDRKLLEDAAKAAGLNVDIDENWTKGELPYFHLVDERGRLWNPLTDDGDALRLAVKLGLDFYEGDDDGRAAYVGYYPRTGNTRPQRFMLERHDAHPDPCAATRRAIVRAAAAIGAAK